MRKREISVTCLFSGEAGPVRQIIIRSFCFFLQRELERDGQIPPFPAIFDA